MGDVLVLDCDSIRVTDISSFVGDSRVLCSANTLTKLPICGGERLGVVAPKIPNGADFMLVSMLTETLITTDVGRVEAVTKDRPLACVIEHICTRSDVACAVHSTLSNVGCCVPAMEYNELQHQRLKSAIFNLFIVQRWLTLCAIRTHFGVGSRVVKRVVDEPVVEGKIRHAHGQLFQLADL
ncbi:hypothetical protein [Photobacterium marinum]|uniref:hypothetical protein n=1 Tax=Photobacterium marinum TaxID=1056511 RepID=UPI000568A3D2|nr:hypothetical protein [Photobacterium marinum]